MNINNLSFEDQKRLRKWSWGAFSLTWIWGVSHNVLISLICLAFAPFAFYLGIKGNELAWQNGNFTSVDEMMEKMKIWNTVGLIMFILSCLFFVIQIVFIAGQIMYFFG